MAVVVCVFLKCSPEPLAVCALPSRAVDVNLSLRAVPGAVFTWRFSETWLLTDLLLARQRAQGLNSASRQHPCVPGLC